LRDHRVTAEPFPSVAVIQDFTTISGIPADAIQIALWHWLAKQAMHVEPTEDTEDCGRKVVKLYGGGRLFACRHCYRLGYAVQRIGPLNQAHHNLARLHGKLGAHYERPDLPAPPKPKWMRWKTYSRIAQRIEEGQERLDEAFIAGAWLILARAEKLEQHKRSRR
jgi:hypothetical protein